jgi:hypothetical protein
MTIEPTVTGTVAGTIGLAAGITAAIGGFFSFWYNRKEHRLNGLVQAFNVLSDERHREARKRVYAAFAIYTRTKNTMAFVEDSQKDFTETVRADFDQMGALVRNGTIQKQGFLRAYGETCYRCWNALRDHICEERKRRRFEHYMESFEWLSNESVIFWQRKGIDLTSIATF